MNNIKSDTEQVATFFERYAGAFDSIYGHTERRNAFEKLADNLFRRTMFMRFKETMRYADNPSIKSVIDIGCGPGHYCVEFLKRNKKVTGLDLSEEMLKIAQQHVNSSHVRGEVQFIKADYLEHSFDNKFDAACLMGFFDYIKNPVPILIKLKKDINNEIYASFPKSSGLLALQRRVRYKLRNCPLYLYSKPDVLEMLKEAGLERFVIKSCKRDWFVRVML